MESVVLIIHLFLALAIIGLVLLQRSEGGGLGIGGGGGGMGALAGAQSTANILTRATAICTACFFATSLILGILAGTHSQQTSIMERLDETPKVSIPADTSEESVSNDTKNASADTSGDVKKEGEGAAAEQGHDDKTAPAEVPSAPVAE